MMTPKKKSLCIRTIESTFAIQGLSLIGVVPLGVDTKSFSHFEQWLSKGKHAGMKFLENYKELRRDPSQIEPEMNAAIVFALNYFQGDKVRSSSTRVAQYARMQDYHKFMKKKAEVVADELSKYDGFGESFRVVIDSAPILERSLASQTSSGFIGKNTCFIQPQKGSFYLLGEVLAKVQLNEIFEKPVYVDPGKRDPVLGGCGTCKRCQVNCPTGALESEYQLDANLCLSYWSIEHRGTIPRKIWPHFKQYWFGCDICQTVCPYNRKASTNFDLPLKDSLRNVDLYEVAVMSQRTYEELFGGSPMTRAKRAGLSRNALIAMAVTGDTRVPEAVKKIRALEGDNEMLMETCAQVEIYHM